MTSQSESPRGNEHGTSRGAPQAEAPPRRGGPWAFPITMLVLSALVVGAFAVCHAAGMREGLSALFGTARGGGSQAFGSALRSAACYVLSYLGTVVLVPILLIAAAIFTLAQLALRRLRLPETVRAPRPRQSP